MSWTKPKDASETSGAPDLSNLAQPAPGKQLATEPETASTKKIPVPPAMLTPEMQAYTSQMISEAVRGVFESMGPLLQSIALTPQKLKEAEDLRRAPDAAKVARELRERKLMHEEEKENRANLARFQAACPHKYPSGGSAINLIHNYPDRQARGICVLCALFLQPRRWEILAPDADNPRGRAVIVDAHPQYDLVRQVQAVKG